MKLSSQLIKWMKDQLAVTPAQGFVFGLSGGIDSAVIAGLVKQATNDKHKGFFMPCYSVESDKLAVQEINEFLDLNLTTIDIGPVLDEFLKILPSQNRLVIGNLKARLRMAALYKVAAELNYLVVGSSNKTEHLLGYFTKFGDGAADIAPLQDLLKKDVRLIASELGIPESIINRPPSAGLWEGQTDEEEIGLSYDILDQAIIGLERGSAIVPFRAMEKVLALNKVSEHKRQGPPKFIST